MDIFLDGSLIFFVSTTCLHVTLRTYISLLTHPTSVKLCMHVVQTYQSNGVLWQFQAILPRIARQAYFI